MRPPESSKIAQNEAEGPQKRFQNYLGIEDYDFSKIELPFYKINIFDGGRVKLGVQNRPQEAPGGDKKRHRKKKKEKNNKIPSRATKMLWDQTVPKILKALGPLENPHETPRKPQERPK